MAKLRFSNSVATEDSIISNDNSEKDLYSDFILEDSRSFNTDVKQNDKSKYDDDITTPYFTTELRNKRRAENQGFLDEFGNIVAKSTINGTLGIIGTAANLLDVRNLANTFNPEVNHDYRNFITDITDSLKENVNEQLPVYKENPNQLFDPTDSAWWNDVVLGTTAESAISFSIPGAAIAKGLDKLTKIAKTAEAFKAANLLNRTNQLTTAITLTYAEGVQSAAEVAKQVLENGGTQEEAANAGATTVRTNMFNLLLNYTSVSPLFRTQGASRTLVNDTLRPLIGESAEKYAARTGKELSELINPVNTLRKIGLEAPQEALEEAVNVYAENQGKVVGGLMNEEDATLTKTLLSEEGLQAMFLGAFGGVANTVALQGIENLSKGKDNKNSNQIIKEQYAKQREFLTKSLENQFGDKASTFSDKILSISKLQNQLVVSQANEESAANNEDEHDMTLKNIKNKVIDEVAYLNFAMGTGEVLLDHIQNLSSMTDEQLINNQLVQDKSEVSEYRETLGKALNRVKTNEKLYNDISFKYESQGGEYISQVYDLETKIADSKESINLLNAKRMEILSNSPKDNDNNIIGKSSERIANIDNLTKQYEDILKETTLKLDEVKSKKYRDSLNQEKINVEKQKVENEERKEAEATVDEPAPVTNINLSREAEEDELYNSTVTADELDDLDIDLGSLEDDINSLKSKNDEVREKLKSSSKLATRLSKKLDLKKFKLEDLINLYNSEKWRNYIKDNFSEIKKLVEVIQTAANNVNAKNTPNKFIDEQGNIVKGSINKDIQPIQDENEEFLSEEVIFKKQLNKANVVRYNDILYTQDEEGNKSDSYDKEGNIMLENAGAYNNIIAIPEKQSKILSDSYTLILEEKTGESLDDLKIVIKNQDNQVIGYLGEIASLEKSVLLDYQDTIQKVINIREEFAKNNSLQKPIKIIDIGSGTINLSKNNRSIGTLILEDAKSRTGLNDSTKSEVKLGIVKNGEVIINDRNISINDDSLDFSITSVNDKEQRIFPEGSKVLLIPHKINASTSKYIYRPTLLVTKKFSSIANTNKELFNKVRNNLNKLLEFKNTKTFGKEYSLTVKELSKYLYFIDNTFGKDDSSSSIGYSGFVIDYNNEGKVQYYVNGSFVSVDELLDLVYPHITARKGENNPLADINYYNELINSGLFETRVQNLNRSYEGKNYPTYFSQYTLEFDTTNEVIDNNIPDISDEDYADEDIDLGSSDNEFKLISNKLSAYLQQLAVRTIMSKLLNNVQTDKLTNKEKALEQLNVALQQAKNEISKNSSTGKKFIEFDTVNNLTEIIDNYNEFFKAAEKQIEQLLNIKANEDGYYELLETSDEAVDQYVEDSVLRENRAEGASAQVKRFLYTLTKRNENGKEVMNTSLNLPIMEDYLSLINALSTEISSNKFYSSDRQGIEDMISNLENSPSPTLNYIGSQLKNYLATGTNSVLVTDFFTLFSQQHAIYKKLLNNSTKEGLLNGYIGSRLINADGTSARKQLVKTWQSNWLNNNNIILTKEVDENGYTQFVINTKVAQDLYNKYKNIVTDKNNYVNLNKDVVISAEAIQQISDLINAIGLPISKSTISKYLDSISYNANKQKNHQNKLASVDKKGELNNGTLDLLFRRLAGYFEETQNEFKSTLTYKNNIFEQEGRILEALARFEYLNTNNQFSMSFRIDGKNYYSMIRSTPLSDMINRRNNPDYLALKEQYDVFYKNTNWKNVQLELGYELTLNYGTESKLLKDAIPLEHEVYKIMLFQNSLPNGTTWYVTDTHSDKTTKPLIKAPVKTIGVDKVNENYVLDDITLTYLYNYFLTENDRILTVNNQNRTLESNKKIKGYHDKNGVEGGGSKFLLYPRFNREILLENNKTLYYLLYDENGNYKGVSDNNKLVDLIKAEINSMYSDLINQQLNDWKNLGIIKDNKYSFFAPNYVNRLVKQLREKGLENNNENIINAAVADYVVNYTIASIETLMITGDPAFQWKPIKNGTIMQNIASTFDNVSKRNARLLAQRQKGLFLENSTYTVSYANDIGVDSKHLADYNESYRKAYEDDEKGTDAQEFTTVYEHLTVQEAYGKITKEEKELLFEYLDPIHYKIKNKGKEARTNFSKKELDIINNSVIGALKPVQVGFEIDVELGIQKQEYIKTSSVPLIPSLVKDRPFEKLHFKMISKEIDRVVFISGAKIGVTGTQDLIINNEFNESFGENNIHTLNRNTFGIQLELPYDSEKDAIGEGTQQMKLLFVDMKETDKIGDKTVGEIKSRFISLHEKLYQRKFETLMEYIGAVKDKKNYVPLEPNQINKLQQILIKEAEDRNYSSNAIEALKVIDGSFRIPLSFNTFSTKIEPVLLSLFTNKLTKFKLPGKSFVQVSEAPFRTYGKKDIKELNEVSNLDIIWINEEVKNEGKLNHIRKEKDENVQIAQILIPSYFKGIDLTKFVNEKGYLDLDKVDSKLLEVFGFRVPTQGHNSMMVFEIVGFLPNIVGDIVVVPHEIAVQMGSDYDVDKLFMYNNHYEQKENKLNKISSSLDTEVNNLTDNEIEQQIVDISKLVVSSPLMFEKVVAPLDSTNDNALNKLAKQYKSDDTFITGVAPLYQRNQYFENRAGQFGVGVTANTNTFHANSQNANLYLKDTSVSFYNDSGEIISESLEDIKTNRVNDYSKELYGDINPNGLFRLDLINSYNSKTGKFDGRPISSIISEWLGTSVDNAKDKTLGKVGVNQQNFNVAMLLMQVGLDNEFILPFINQPILKEYYNRLANIDNIYDVKYVQDIRGSIQKSLLDELTTILQENKINPLSDSQIFNIKYLNSNLNNKYDSIENAYQNLSILQAFINYDTIAGDLTTIQRNTNTDVKGLPASITALKSKLNDILDLSKIDTVGNIDRINTNTLSGIFTSLPFKAYNILQNLFIENTSSFNYVIDKIKTVKSYLSEEDTYLLKNHLQAYVYTHPEILNKLLENSNYNDTVNSLLENDNLANRINEAKVKYKNNLLLQRLNIQADSLNNENHSIITINNTTNENKIFEDSILIEWSSMLKSSNEEIRKLANDLAKYTLLFNSQQVGAGNLIKYLPISYLDNINFGKTLSSFDYNNTDFFTNFIDQFLKHNPSFAKNGFKLKQAIEEGKKNKKEIGNIVYNERFKDIIDLIEVDNTYEGFQLKDKTGDKKFPEYINLLSNNKIRYLYKLEEGVNGKVRYVRQTKLGKNNFTEYLFNSIDKPSLFTEQNVNFVKPVIQKENKQIWSSENFFGLGNSNFSNGFSIIASMVNNPLTDNIFEPLIKYLIENNQSELENIKVVVTDNPKIFAQTDNVGKTVTLNKSRILNQDNYNIQRIIIHEILHGLSNEKLNNNSYPRLTKVFKQSKELILNTEKAKKEYDTFVKIFDLYKKDRNKDLTQVYKENGYSKITKERVAELKSLYYPLYNEREFITEVLTNKDFQETLRKKPSIWNEILEFFAKLFSGNSEKPSLLTDAIDVALEIIQPINIKKSTEQKEEVELEDFDETDIVDNLDLDLGTTVVDFMKELTAEEREVFREFRAKGIYKTKC